MKWHRKFWQKHFHHRRSDVNHAAMVQNYRSCQTSSAFHQQCCENLVFAEKVIFIWTFSQPKHYKLKLLYLLAWMESFFPVSLYTVSYSPAMNTWLSKNGLLGLGDKNVNLTRTPHAKSAVHTKLLKIKYYTTPVFTWFLAKRVVDINTCLALYYSFFISLGCFLIPSPLMKNDRD